MTTRWSLIAAKALTCIKMMVVGVGREKKERRRREREEREKKEREERERDKGFFFF